MKTFPASQRPASQRFVMAIGLLAIWAIQPAIAQKQSERPGDTTSQQEEPADKESADKELEQQVIETSKELIQTINQGGRSPFLLPASKLPEAEIAKAVESLRNQYPFESLRARLRAQPLAADIKPVEVITKKQHLKVAASSTQPQVLIFNPRAHALASLHSEEVDGFINRSGNGFSRMRIISPYDLPLTNEYAHDLVTRPVDSTILGEPEVKLGAMASSNKQQEDYWTTLYSLSSSGLPSLDLATNYHELTQRGFARVDTLGYFKSVDQVAGFDAHQVRIPADQIGSIRGASLENLEQMTPKPTGLDVDWKTNRLQLVSLLLHDTPQVYVSQQLPDMEDLSGAEVETRELDEFERAGLADLRSGEQVVTTATRNRIVMLGAIRANANCIECHTQSSDGELLGAFSYEFLRDPMVDADYDRF